MVQVLALSETFGRADQPSTFEPIDGFKSFRVERAGSDKGGGGLNLVYKESLSAHEWSPVVPTNLAYIQNERQWLLFNSRKEKVAFLHVYIACESHRDDSFLQWNEDLFFLITQEAIKMKRQGFTVVAMGDFNSRLGRMPGLEFNQPSTNRNAPMFLNFVTEANLVIMNTLPISKGTFTRFMDSSGQTGSSSLLDYGLIDAEQAHTVTSFVIDSSARFDCGSDHALLECKIIFDHVPRLAWSYQDSIQYNLQNVSDYTKFQDCLNEAAAAIPLSEFEKLSSDQMLPHITESINSSAIKSFGLKVKKKKKPGRRLPRHLIDTIEAKNRLVKHLANSSDTIEPNELLKLRADLEKLKSEIRDHKADFLLQRRYRLRSKLLLADPTRKKFWRFLRSQIKAAGNISALRNKDGAMVFEQDDIEEAVLDHFAAIFEGKRHPVFVDKTPVDHTAIALQEIEEILRLDTKKYEEKQFEDHICPPFSFVELEKTLADLPTGKATGYDRVPNELLKNSSFDFKQYLMIFYNKILSDGSVPEPLNQGKCILIYKVIKS